MSDSAGITESTDTAASTETAESTEMNMLTAINHTLHREMARDDRVIVLGEDVGANGGVFRATEGLYDEFGATRVVDTPLAEGVILGASVGLAASGLVPVPEIQFLGFVYQAFHQLAGQVARMRYRTRGRFHAGITIRAPFGGGIRTPELHSDALEGQLCNIPGLKVVMPASAADAKGLLATAIRDPDPVLFLEPLRGYRLIKGQVPTGEHLVPFGRAATVTEGDDVVLIAWSYMVEVCRRAAGKLSDLGISARVLDLRTLVPLDTEAITSAVEECGRAVVVQEAPRTGGFASDVVAEINDRALWSLEAPVARVSAYDNPYPVGLLEDDYLPDVDKVVEAARRTVEAS